MWTVAGFFLALSLLTLAWAIRQEVRFQATPSLAEAHEGDLVTVEGTLDCDGPAVISELVAGAHQIWSGRPRGSWHTSSYFRGGPLYLVLTDGRRILIRWTRTKPFGSHYTQQAEGSGRRAAGYRIGDPLVCTGQVTSTAPVILDIDPTLEESEERGCEGGTRDQKQSRLRFLTIVMGVLASMMLAVGWAIVRGDR